MFDDVRYRLNMDALATPSQFAWMHSIADAAIGLSYIAIAVALVTLVRRRDDVRWRGVFVVLAALIALSGACHLSAIWTLFLPDAAAAALVELGAAVITASTAVALWKLLPRALSLPSAEHLRAVDHALQMEIAARMRAEERLRQAQKSEAIGQLTGGVAHDFNNMLTVVSGNVELATRALNGVATGQKTPTDKAERHLASAMKGIEQAELLTRRLLAFSQRRTLDVRTSKVNKLIGGMSELLTRALGEAVEVRAVLGQGVGTVEVDRNQLESALLNIAVNAREAMRRNDVAEGTLTITTENIRLDDGDAQRRGMIGPGEYVLISVGDTGAAPGRDNLDFAQVSDFATHAGGHFAIEPRGDEGTVVRLYLPRIDAVATAGRSTDAGFVTRARGETVLVVEDDPDVRAYVVESLGDIGYAVVEAPDAADALDILDSARHIDVLLTDVVMPRMSGRVLAATAQAQRQGLRVLYMTGFARKATSLHKKGDAGVAMIAKPFTLPVLAGKLREVLDASAPQERRVARL